MKRISLALMGLVLMLLLLAASAQATTTFQQGFQNPPAGTSRYNAKDDALQRLDALKVVETGVANPKYVGLAHTVGPPERIHVETSNDLLNWHFERDLPYTASQGAIKQFGGTFFVAFEESGACQSGGRCLRLQNWLSLTALLSGSPYIDAIIPRTLGTPSKCEGTPDFVGNPSFTSLTLGFHYNYASGCLSGNDREARGTMTNFGGSNTWTATPDTALQTALTTLGVGGNQGDRDDFTYNGEDWTVAEGQVVPGDFCSFRLYALNRTTGASQALPVNTGGANAQANPSVTLLTLPDGSAGAFAGIFLHSPSSCPAPTGKANELIYYWKLNPPVVTAPCTGAAPSPSGYQHVVWVFLENKNLSSITSSAAPNLSHVASECGSSQHYKGIVHPSLSNYLAATAGSTLGYDGSDSNPPNPPTNTTENIFHQLGSDWRSYHEGMDQPCSYSSDATYAGTTFRGSSGNYIKHHNPALYYKNLSGTLNGGNGTCATNDVNLPAVGSLDLSKKFTFIAPNNCNNMHSCSIATGDAWVGDENSGFLKEVFATPEWQAGNTLVIVTFDESGGSYPTAPIENYFAVIAPSVVPGTSPAASYNHYSLLGTTEDLLGLARINNAVGAGSFASDFHLVP